MSDQRPQYGEYASPEEQRRLAGLPPADAPQPAYAPPPAASAPSGVPVLPTAAARPAANSADRIITLILLALGLINVLTTAMSFLDLVTPLNAALKMMGVDAEYTNYEAARLWGTISAVVLVGAWALTLWWSLKRLKTGKLTFWVPLVGAVVAYILVSICIASAFAADPALAAVISSTS